ncbi:Asparagine synthetase B (glutamine-hydrolyzing) (AsnB) (PDB:2ETD) (PUBMED:25951518) [Commensalibacter communis]|uniref:asparagine synthase (glutamine-hydrolyzing) n=1 Tax=Commensalibacter communis TaxID=2972786 RepID=UPI0022FF86D1|nr:asparagine synthase (glutamine-hydrolyzing) [Commensalibacter communis]CAI3926419.1 Asparagine synthetase B (glutamine-hydrolyzing) (AsnB) (PDB:2ETD) (PUBMED:25951518) [Commensalibacter communis]CAI3932734.1 Asparagine synthetase B (glutamine-hydrolyzing) (AsnB) (PDB:2ETD) (PUBMED:25951518) [Commensalibacter communis]
MCGLAGIALKSGYSITNEQKDLLKNALAHRGPDGSGEYIGQHAVLIHTRLSIIDLDGGKQPLSSPNKQFLVANGEIYNDLELRDSLLDYPFQTGSDCECIIPLWQQFKEKFPEKLRGMYAVALVDVDEHTLILSRDPFGIKPLYYACVEEGVVFASEAQALTKAGFVQPTLRQEGIESLLQLQFIPGKETIFQNIHRLLPGETLIIQDGVIVLKKQIEVFKEQNRIISNPDFALSELDHILEETVCVHERSDVPFGLFLSSGIDSSIILKMMQRLGQEKRVRAWTARFETDDRQGYVADETDQASLLAKQVGAEHHIFSITQEQVWQYLPQIVACMDDPVADYAIIPTWFLAKEASQSVKVILSGEGGDELFAGYGRYRKASQPWWRGGKKMYRKGVFDQTDHLRSSLSSWRDEITAYENACDFSSMTRLTKAQKIDIETWLPNDLLIKLDRCLMAHGIEGRVPFLDKKVAEFAFSLSDSLKVQNRQGKWILRKWLEKYFPESKPFAPKLGFSVPIGLWIEQQAKILAPIVSQQAGIKEIAFSDKILPLFEKASGRKERYMAWNLLFYALWHQIHIVGQSPNGSVTDILAV